ncbi:cytochrome c biogenesis protein CcdA [Halobacteroides halobius]|uniref:cytochrome c biogenesis protein CcdA n=1 Tax=Halobacteroides halobius TaxID=42422 RepID=UPI00059FD7EA
MSVVVAFMAGVASFVSPCVLPLVPAYIGYITGSAIDKGRLFTVVRALGFVIGFSIIFITMGASASYIGRLFSQYKLLFTKVSGILIIIFGLHMTGLFKLKLLYQEFRVQGPRQATNWFSSILMGMAFAAGWIPCVGTVLGSILLYAGAEATLKTGVLLLTAYSLGLGLPFILTAIFINQFSNFSNHINNYLPIISKFSGVIMIVFGVLLYLNKVQQLSQYFYF